MIFKNFCFTAIHITLVNLNAHAFLLIIMFLHLIMLGDPIRLRDCIFPIVFGVVYSSFSLYYFLADGTDRRLRHKIYPLLDWAEPVKSTIVVFVSIFVVFVIHSLIFGIYKLREIVKSKLFKPKMDATKSSADAETGNI